MFAHACWQSSTRTHVKLHLRGTVASYSNDCARFHHYYPDLQILQNRRFLIQGWCLEKFQGYNISGLCGRHDSIILNDLSDILMNDYKLQVLK